MPLCEFENFHFFKFGTSRGEKSTKILVLKTMMRLLRFGLKRAQNRTRNFLIPLLLESNFIWPPDHVKCVFGCPAFFSSLILGRPGRHFYL